MRRIERRVVALLARGEPDAARLEAIQAYVGETLRLMPDHLRLGVALESAAIGTVDAAARAVGLLDDDRLRLILERWEASSVTPLRQYVRLLRSLTLYAGEELDHAVPAPPGAVA
ncbi:MAG: hypothetical protein KJ056_01800 [Acidimicrobiia bacterium]|nr:hypothetical protein [Acidimicrobiia bacterium]